MSAENKLGLITNGTPVPQAGVNRTEISVSQTNVSARNRPGGGMNRLPASDDKWSTSVKGGIQNSPAVTKEGVVIAGSMEGELVAYEFPPGARLWNSSSLGAYIISSPTLSTDGSQNYTYVTVQGKGQEQSILYSFKTQTGEQVFRRNLDVANITPGAAYSSPVMFNDSTALLVAVGDTFFAIQALNKTHVGNNSCCERYAGEVIWKTKYPGQKLLSSAVVRNNLAYFTTANRKEVVAVHTDTGLQCWAQDLGSYTSSTPVLDPELPILYATSTNGVHAINIGTGLGCVPTDRLLWSYAAPMGISSVALGHEGHNLYFGTMDNQVVSLLARDAAVGVNATVTVRWTYGINGALRLSSPVVDENEIVYVSTEGGVVYAFNGSFEQGAPGTQQAADEDSGGFRRLLWSYETDSGDPIYASPSLGPNGSVIIASTSGQLLAITEGSMVPIQGLKPSPISAGGEGLSEAGIIAVVISSVLLASLLSVACWFCWGPQKDSDQSNITVVVPPRSASGLSPCEEEMTGQNQGQEQGQGLEGGESDKISIDSSYNASYPTYLSQQRREHPSPLFQQELSGADLMLRGRRRGGRFDRRGGEGGRGGGGGPSEAGSAAGTYGGEGDTYVNGPFSTLKPPGTRGDPSLAGTYGGEGDTYVAGGTSQKPSADSDESSETSDITTPTLHRTQQRDPIPAPLLPSMQPPNPLRTSLPPVAPRLTLQHPEAPGGPADDESKVEMGTPADVAEAEYQHNLWYG